VSKVAKIAAIVVGVAAVVLTAGTALFGAAAVAAFLGVSVGALATITAVLGVTASVLSVAAGLTAPKPTFGSLAGAGTQLDFTGDPSAGMPYIMGNARVGEAVVHEASWGDKNKFLGIIGVLSCAGPIMAYDGFYADNTLTAFSGGAASGYYAGYLYEQTQLGARPEAAALAMTAPDASVMPDWGSDYKLSSLAAAGLIMVADIDNGKIWSGGVPQFTHQARGVMAYDPRLDSTNGGSGSQRPGGLGAVETAYAYSENPWVHHGTFALGRWVNGVRVIGPGLPSASIDWASHIEAANVADANGWKISGRVLSTDNKWDVLRSIAQAGGGYPIPTQAKLSCLVNTPRVSLETIEESDVKGHVSVPQMAMRRDRLNGAMARYREPSLAWQVLDGNIIRNSDYLAADGGTTKTKEIDLPMVSDKHQAAQLVGYEVANSRERTAIQVPLDLYWSQYKTGDCLTLNLPSALLFNQKCVIIGRDIDAESGIVTFTFRTEDDAKHTWALGLTGAAPVTTVTTPPGTGDTGGTLSQIQTALLNSYPVGLTLTGVDSGSSATIQFSAFTLEYPGQAVSIAAHNLTGLAYSTSYYPYLDVTGPGDAAPTFGAASNYFDSLNSATHPYRINLFQNIITPAAGGSSTGGTTAGGGGGISGDPGASVCLVEDAALLLANAAHDGPGATVRNGDTAVGDWVYTKHHVTGEWMAAQIVAQRRKRARVYHVPGLPLGTKGHISSPADRIAWEQAHKSGKFVGWRWVIDRTVAVANTYFTPGGGEIREGGVVNHNVSPVS
jgi:hypothetical protein